MPKRRKGKPEFEQDFLPRMARMKKIFQRKVAKAPRRQAGKNALRLWGLASLR